MTQKNLSKLELRYGKVFSVLKAVYQRYRSLGAIRLYGTSDEFAASTGLNYSALKWVAGLRYREWWQAARVTRKIYNDRFRDKLVSRASLSNLRVVGAGLQNCVTVERLIAHTRQELAKRNVRLVTFFIVPETIENYVQGMKASIRGTGNLGGYVDGVRFNLPGKTIDKGMLINKNVASEHCTVIAGERVFPHAISSRQEVPRILFFGASEVFGTFLSDKQTIPAAFQGLCSDNEEWRCVNLGMGGVNFIDVVSNVLKTKLKASDTVVLAVPYGAERSHIDVSITLNDEDLFDYSHVKSTGSLKVAKQLFDFICEVQPVLNVDLGQRCAAAELCLSEYQRFILSCEAKEIKSGLLQSDLSYFRSWRESVVNPNANVGSVAVNCNPITLGHEYLIDYARQQVDVLFVLVIQEDSSEVSFEDRFAMVELVCRDKPNVHVLRGGSFVCTEYIAPEYFVKEDVSDEAVDFSLESFYFGQFIAPELGVQTIFLGHEPKCHVTQQYNDHMVQSMPSYGVLVDIIPRLTSQDGNFISASLVRKFIKEREFEKLSGYVPEICIPYLESDHFSLKS